MTTILESVCYIVVIILVLLLFTKLFRYHRLLTHYNVGLQNTTSGHHWIMIDSFNSKTFCNVSNHIIIHGARCDWCGIVVDDQSKKVADTNIQCKAISLDQDVMLHHWVAGNIRSIVDCHVCGEYCEDDDGLNDLRCVWCSTIIHCSCLSGISKICDLGQYKEFIIPPYCLSLKDHRTKNSQQFRVSSVKYPDVNNWNPVIVIGNQKSGDYLSKKLLQDFRYLLHPTQVIDLHENTPESGLELCHLMPEVLCYVIICGGDGTIGWVLDAMDKLNLKTPPIIRVIPLGTGNDLSQSLGWGGSFITDQSATDILDSLRHAHCVKLDRWNVAIKNSWKFGLSQWTMPSQKVMKMNNYLSVGCDALVTLNFHKRRESWPSLFSNRFFNKFTYFTFGCTDVWERECKNLNKKIKVELDDKPLELPDIESVVVLNISSWGGGCQPWMLGCEDSDNFLPARHDDGLLEVMGIYSSFHIAQMQVGLAQPLRFGQAHQVKISIHGTNTPVQVDGEPWEQHPADIIITHSNQVTLLANASSDKY